MKKVLITGGKGDIAKAIIHKLYQNGGYTIFTPSKEEMDVADIDSVKKYVDNIEPDILINNAGFIETNAISLNKILEEKKNIDINLFGVFNCSGAVLKKNSNAMIINIGSSAGTKVHGGWSAYCAAKAAVIMATKCWAEEGVNSICISPGRTATKMRKKLFPNEDKNTLLKTEEFAEIVVRAIEGKYECGSNIDVNVDNIGVLIND